MPFCASRHRRVGRYRWLKALLMFRSPPLRLSSISHRSWRTSLWNLTEVQRCQMRQPQSRRCDLVGFAQHLVGDLPQQVWLSLSARITHGAERRTSKRHPSAV